MKIIKQLTLLLIISCIYSSCSKNCEKSKGTKYLSQEDKDLIPYKGNEVLKFLNKTSGDTLVFKGEMRWTSYYNNNITGADCVAEEKFEGRGIAFINSIKKTKIVLNQLIPKNVPNSRDFEVNYNDSFTLVTSDIGQYMPEDSIILQNIVYRNVYYVYGRIKQAKDIGYYFTEKEGILKIYGQGDTLEIIK